MKHIIPTAGPGDMSAGTQTSVARTDQKSAIDPYASVALLNDDQLAGLAEAAARELGRRESHGLDGER